MKNLWLRAGVSLQITKEEEEIFFTADCETKADTFKKIVSEGRFIWDGDTYIPEDIVNEFNHEHGTDYEVSEYFWDL